MANEYRVTQVGVEVLGSSSAPDARVTQVGVEVLGDAAQPEARVAMVKLEVLRSIAGTPYASGQRRMQFIIT